MRENLSSIASTRCAMKALHDAKRAASPEDRKFHLDQAAIYAHLAEKARRSGMDVG